MRGVVVCGEVYGGVFCFFRGEVEVRVIVRWIVTGIWDCGGDHGRSLDCGVDHDRSL